LAYVGVGLRYAGKEEKMRIRDVLVHPKLPPRLKKLQDLAMNVWFSWNWEAVRLFIRLNPDLWEKCYQNPVQMLGRLSPQEIKEAEKDDAFVADLERVYQKFDDYMKGKHWFGSLKEKPEKCRIGYFSFEYGIDESLPIYSGGLGILAGDHLKSSSDLGVPLVGIGLLWQKGYLRQVLNLDGWQSEAYPQNDWYNMPVCQERDKSGNPVSIQVELGAQTVKANIWRVQAGRNPLYLLDTNIPENPPVHRDISGQLYGGDIDMRIRQEILLGIGGVRALKAVGIEPVVYHMNEGHAAFLALERLRELVEAGMSYETAREIVWASTVFTTHTPVPAGNDVFAPDLVKKYMEPYSQKLGIGWDKFLKLGQDGPDSGNGFCMTVLALKLAAFCNGVSKLHGSVSRSMWSHLWRNLPVQEVPIDHITNGVHTRSWISHDMGDMLERYLGPNFSDESGEEDIWKRVDNIPESELWRVHNARKERLIFFARKRLKRRLQRLGAGPAALHAAGEVLSPDVLTIGFARRFATYKRANLLWRDPERVIKILTNPQRPVQLILAGKAHPKDTSGKELIKLANQFAADPRLAGRVVFLEDYDINVARYMLQGVDVWLNTPRRPLEASGTSGMKAAANGGLNFSVLDGWWDEGYECEVGWTIGAGEVYDSPEEQDNIESEVLYRTLETEIIPLFYQRDKADLPRRWIEMMKASIKKLGAVYNTHRMVKDYTTKFYIPANRARERLMANDGEGAEKLAAWRKKIAKHWATVSLKGEEVDSEAKVRAGESIPVRVRAKLGSLKPDDVSVQVYYGRYDWQGEIVDGATMELSVEGRDGNYYIFSGNIPTEASGRYGMALRVLPHHKDLVHPLTPLMLTWE